MIGGSLGALALNDVVPRALALMPPQARPIVTHQSGEKHIETLRAAYADAGVEAECLPFIDDMARRYAEADVVVCRSGATTVAELAAVGVASLLVPFPYAADDHQVDNAEQLVRRGAAELWMQRDFKAQRLADWLAEARPPEARDDGGQRARASQSRRDEARGRYLPRARETISDEAQGQARALRGYRRRRHERHRRGACDAGLSRLGLGS